jgi:acyl-coenzyme A synthetase/AMP-(fatty) acid ligase
LGCRIDRLVLPPQLPKGRPMLEEGSRVVDLVTGQVERVLEDHPAVREAAVVGGTVLDSGGQLTAYVVAAVPALCEADLVDHVRQRLPRLSEGPRLVFVAGLPRGRDGKLDVTRLWPG